MPKTFYTINLFKHNATHLFGRLSTKYPHIVDKKLLLSCTANMAVWIFIELWPQVVHPGLTVLDLQRLNWLELNYFAKNKFAPS